MPTNPRTKCATKNELGFPESRFTNRLCGDTLSEFQRFIGDNIKRGMTRDDSAALQAGLDAHGTGQASILEAVVSDVCGAARFALFTRSRFPFGQEGGAQ